MKVTATEIERIAKTLPVGYYAFGRIPIEVDKEGKFPTSFYSPVENKIVIAAKVISDKLATVNSDDETLKTLMTRSTFYHEVSHTILTPRVEVVTDQFNIIEDARIERKFKNYYLEVDFDKANKVYCDWDGTGIFPHPVQSPQQLLLLMALFNYKPTAEVAPLTDKAQRIINDYLNNLTGINSENDWYTQRYIAEINDLWEKVKDLFPKIPPESIGKQDSGESGADGQNGYNRDVSDSDKNENSKAGKGEASDEKSEAEAKAESESNSLTEEELKRIRAELNDRVKAIFNQYISNDIAVEEDVKLTDGISRVIEDFNKRSNGGSAIPTYSGILNPRNCSREDYRFFDKKSVVNGANKYGSLNLNLFIDVSGSMSRSTEELNQLLKSIYNVAKKHKNFSYSIITCSCGQVIQNSKSHCFVKCTGGNRITDDIFAQYRSLQKQNTVNYNIALFDGDAFSDGGRHSNFGVFNHPNCVMITDPENEDYLHYIPQARKIVTHDYAEELKNTVVKMLSVGFR